MEFFCHRNYENATNLIIHDHHLIKVSRVITLVELRSTEIYSILISSAQKMPSSKIYFENLHNDYNIDWTETYILPRLVNYNTYVLSFQYRFLNNVLFLNKNFIGVTSTLG